MNLTPLTERQKEILRKLEELYEEQRPFLRAMSPEQATANPVSFADFEAFGHRADEIKALQDELIRSVSPVPKTRTIPVRCPHCRKDYEVVVAPKPGTMGHHSIECLNPDCKRQWAQPLPGEIVSGPTPKPRV